MLADLGGRKVRLVCPTETQGVVPTSMSVQGILRALSVCSERPAEGPERFLN